jgi:dTDP-4-amino-4,6-dideoxygalactose transaminase
MKNIAPIYITKPFLPPFEEFNEGLKRIWNSRMLTNFGPLYTELLSCLKNYLQVENLSLVVNGHQALEIAISALQLSGEVITTPFTFASTTHAIVRSGLEPVFCDIRMDNYNIDESKIEALITNKTSAILPVHVFGTPCNVEAIDSIAKQYGIKVIYDAAHAFGVKIGDRGIGSFGDITMFSFHATKVYNTIEGGALAFSNKELARDIYLRQDFGIANSEEVLLPGTNAKMNEFQALMGLLNLKYIDQEIINRQKKVELYRHHLRAIPGIKLLSNNIENLRENCAYFPIVVTEDYGLTRNELALMLQKHNIFPRKYFYPLTMDYACYRGKYRGETPTARYIADRVLCLPIWGEIDSEVIDYICGIISDLYNSYGLA